MTLTLADFPSSAPGALADSVLPAPRYIHGVTYSLGTAENAILYIACVAEPDPVAYVTRQCADAFRAEKKGALKGVYAALAGLLRSGARIDATCYRELPAGTRVGDAAALVANWIVTARGGGHPVANSAEDETEAGQVLKISRAIAFGKAVKARNVANAEKRKGNGNG
jgi:hypothetical protein